MSRERSGGGDAASLPRPECLTLGVVEGSTPSSRPPVRIFLGTEPRQWRAERVFLWSIERTRDPARVYEIYRLERLAGFRTRGWTTGFTNYRFAIPELAGRCGRAIYNDVDQIYLADPAELFDTDLGDHGFLALSDAETSVMLLDCARMASVWSIAAARRLGKRALLARARERSGLRGALAPEWNARDAEHVAGRSKLLHYTTLHTQPWRPFPEQFTYLETPEARVWLELEAEADAAGYGPFAPAHPSARFAEALAAEPAPGLRRARVDRGALEAFLVEASCRDVAELGWSELRQLVRGDAPLRRSEGVAVLAGLERVPVVDLPWVLHELFRRARRFLFAEIRLDASALEAAPDAAGFETIFERVAARHPEVHWRLVLRQRHRLSTRVRYLAGGRRPDTSVRAWVLLDDRPGNNTQSLGLADALGWPVELKRLRFGALARVHPRLLGASRLGLARGSDALEPPWPDLVISAGRRAAPVAAWIRASARGRTRVVQLGRKGGAAADPFDLVVAPRHARLWPHPRRLETTAPLNRLNEAVLGAAAERGKQLFEAARTPRIALLVGGSTPRYRLDAATAAQLGERVRALSERLGGSVFVTTSRRTGAAAGAALAAALPEAVHFHHWAPDDRENPYLAYLSLADVLVVTGESESMLAEACSTGRAVLIYALPAAHSFSPGRWLGEAVLERARARPANARGTARPQRGLERLCARLLSSGLVRPVRDLERLHADLVAGHHAQMLPRQGALPDLRPGVPLRELSVVAQRVRALVGVPVP